MKDAVVAGVIYGAAAFAIGLVLGTLRTLAVAPAVGPLAAVLIELPVILVLTWALCGRLTARLDVPARAAPRLAMGAVGFAVLMLAEAVLSVTFLGRSLAEHFALLVGAAPERVGLAGQVQFALFPLLRR